MKITKKQAIILGAVALVGVSSLGNNLGDTEQETETGIETVIVSGITDIRFCSDEDVEIREGRKDRSWISVSGIDKDEFSADDIVFVSENTDIATIEADGEPYGTFLYYNIKGVGGGETYVYAQSAEGDVVSEKIRVIVEEKPETKPKETETEKETEPETKPKETEPPKQAENKPKETTAPVKEPEPETVLKLVSVTSPVSRNEYATLTAKGKPNTEYTISVYYSTSASTAAGLEKKTSDADGNVSWTWKVGGKTNAGSHRIVVSGGNERIETAFTTTEG